METGTCFFCGDKVIRKSTPGTGSEGLVEYRCEIHGNFFIDKDNGAESYYANLSELDKEKVLIKLAETKDSREYKTSNIVENIEKAIITIDMLFKAINA